MRSVAGPDSTCGRNWPSRGFGPCRLGKRESATKYSEAGELGAISIFQTGMPFTVFTGTPFVLARDGNGDIIYPLQNIGGDYNADGYTYDLPNTPSFGNRLSGKSRSDYITGVLNASDFPAPELGAQGNLGRNTFNGPGFANVDFSLIKNIKIPWFVREGANLQVRTEVFNLFNRVNLGRSGWRSDEWEFRPVLQRLYTSDRPVRPAYRVLIDCGPEVLVYGFREVQEMHLPELSSRQISALWLCSE